MYRTLLAMACLVFSLGAQAKLVSFWDYQPPKDNFEFTVDFDNHLDTGNSLQELGKALSFLKNPHFDIFDQSGSFLDLWIQHVYEHHPKLWSILERHPFFKDKISTPVPIPAGLWLFSSALGLLIVRRHNSAR